MPYWPMVLYKKKKREKRRYVYPIVVKNDLLFVYTNSPVSIPRA